MPAFGAIAQSQVIPLGHIKLPLFTEFRLQLNTVPCHTTDPSMTFREACPEFTRLADF
jgi:hypothetical protein